VGVSLGSDGRLADDRGIEAQVLVAWQGKGPGGGDLHEQVVRVLPVDEEHAAVGLAALEEKRASLGRDRRRLEAEGAEEVEAPRAQRPRRHDHEVIDGLEIARARGSPLPVGVEEGVAVPREPPRRRCGR
jgi:hypothetical protein